MTDSSGALASRFIILMMKHSFYGKEDHGLSDRLLAELPGIFNWALKGWARLKKRDRFVQPASSADAMRELEDLGSPVAAFVRERCEVRPGLVIEVGELFNAWCCWCNVNRHDHPGNIQTFGRNLRAV